MENKYNEPVLDPVCGMNITPETAQATAEYDGRTFYFCSVGCKETFVSHPEKYAHHEQEHRR
jgi:Cu+-exporting ATPase